MTTIPTPLWIDPDRGLKEGRSGPRPMKKAEYELRFASTAARKGWRDLVATIRNPMVDAWDFLTRTLLSTTPSNYRLKGELGTFQHRGELGERWQHKPTLKGSARIWFYVEDHSVHLEQVHTSHPNET